jgi:selenide,water dikinase
MAEGSGVTLVLELSRLPLLDGAEKLAHRPFLTRASATNSSYVAPALKLVGMLDPIRLEFFYDAQTSGGLLISVPTNRADELVQRVRNQGGLAACVIGEVVSRRDSAIELSA